MEKYKLTISIVNWNTQELLLNCLESVYTNIGKDVEYETIVVDNGSLDDSVQLVKNKFPKVRIIENEENLGFAVAHNKALGEAKGEYILFLNTDVILQEGAIISLIGFMDSRHRAGLCTPSLIGRNGRRQETCVTFPSIFTELLGRIKFKESGLSHSVQAVRGACMMARTEAVKSIGGFNEKYFLFLEETDLCMRLNRKGYEVWHVPNAAVYHIGGASAGRDKAGARIEYWRSRYIFFRENYSLPYHYLLNMGLLVKLALDWIGNFAGCVSTLFLNKKIRNKLNIYSYIILWHILGKPCDWGINFTPYIRKEFQKWWDENKKSILSESGNIKPIKENSSRKLFIYNDAAYVKTYKSKSIPVLRNFSVVGFKKPWLREWKIINKIRQSNINTVMPIALGNGYLVTKKLEDVKSLHTFILEDFKNIKFKERLGLIHSFAEFVKKIHIKGILHKDLHAGNILVGEKNGRHEFYITDLHRAGIKTFLSTKDIINNLAELNKFISLQLTRAERARFFKYYVSGALLEENYKLYAKIISQKTDNGCRILWRKRDKLYLKKNKYGTRGRYQDIGYILNPAYNKLEVSNVIEYVRKKYGNIIKNSNSSFVSRFEISGIGSVILKIYKQKKFVNYIKDIFRKSRGFRAWRGAWSLITRGIETAEPIMAGEMRAFCVVKESFIISRDIAGSKNLTLYIKNKTVQPEESFYAGLSKYIRKAHDRGIFPLDMKASNIIVSEENKKSNFYLIDLDHIKVKNLVTLNERLRNVLQIKKSIGIFCKGALPVKRILIVKPSSLGDVVQGFPVADILGHEYKGAGIWWLVNRNYAGLLELIPSINKTIAFDRQRWGKLTNIFNALFEICIFIKGIRKEHFDIALDLQGLFRSGFITRLSGAPVRIGFGDAREFAYIFYTNKICAEKIHAQERYLQLAEYILNQGNRPLSRDIRIPFKLKNWAEETWGNKSKIRIAINPGGRWITKRWPAKKYADLINELNKKYSAKIIILGDKNDKDSAEDILLNVFQPVIDFSGKTDLLELTALLNSSNILITNDSGTMHLADYLKIPIVALFGPTDPDKTGPVGKGNRIIKAGVPCSPCFKRTCSDNKCMESIDVKDVINSAEDILNNNK